MYVPALSPLNTKPKIGISFKTVLLTIAKTVFARGMPMRSLELK